MNNLTEQEQNVIKDILKVIGNDAALANPFATACGMSAKLFDEVADSIFDKLQNGRLTVE